MSTMRAARFMGEGRLVVEDIPAPRVRKPDDVLLEVEAAGICGTDLHILHSPPGVDVRPGTVLGHEYAGRVAEVGPGVLDLKSGDRVVVDPNLRCGACVYCRGGIPHMCEETTALGIEIDGGMAHYSVAPEGALYKVPAGMPPERAVLAEPLACVVHGMDRLRPRPGDRAVVLGAGPIGLMFTQLLIAAGVRPLIVIEPAKIRRDQAIRNGAHMASDPTIEDPDELVHREMGVGADLVVDAVGTQLDQALRMVRRGGTVMVFGQNQSALANVRPFDISKRELTVLGSHTAPFCFPRAIHLLDQAVIDAEKLVSHRLGLGQIQEGLRLLRRGEAIKVVIDPRLG
jgi:threonine dehydrogenase-like Zn-dependent dehydrogenase